MRVSSVNLSTFITKPKIKHALTAAAAGLLTVSCANSNSNNTNPINPEKERIFELFNDSGIRLTQPEVIDYNRLIPEEQSETRKSIGNIVFYLGDLNEKVPVKTKINELGQKEYQVTLKSGTVIGFTDKQSKGAMVLDGIDMGYSGEYKNEGIKFYNCNIKYIRGTDKRNYYYLFYTNVNQIDFGKCTEENMKDELRLVESNCYSIITPDGYARSEVKFGDVISLNEGWFERAEWLDEAMKEF